MKGHWTIQKALHVLAAASSMTAAEGYYGINYVPSAPLPGRLGSTAVSMSDPAFAAWADYYEKIVYGEGAAAFWRTPERALGPSSGTSDNVVSLGRGGWITLCFSNGIADGPGYDFAVFENGFRDSFLELAYVEVSSDGTNFVRFPNYSYTPLSVLAFGKVHSRLVFGLAGKYRQGYGTPFDLAELQRAFDSIQGAQTDFSGAFAEEFVRTFRWLNLQRISHVRLVDCVGDGTAFDSRGMPIYDPYPTAISAGFDLEAAGVLYEADKIDQHIFFEVVPNQLQGSGSVQLKAYASSGLPVILEVVSAPSGVIITDSSTLELGQETGSVSLRASQPGNKFFFTADDVFTDFEIVAEEAKNAPFTWNQFRTLHTLPSDGSIRSDAGRANNFQEFIMGGDPNDPADEPVPVIVSTGSAIILNYVIDRRALGRCRIRSSPDFLHWSQAVPEILQKTVSREKIEVRVRFPSDTPNCFYRMEFTEQQ